MKRVYLVDLIGNHAGMNYYLDSFAESLKNDNLDVVILSNYSVDGNKPFFKNCFNKNKLFGLCCLIYSYFKLLFHLVQKKKCVHIFLSYGEVTDFLFFTSSFFSNKVFIDIHELYAARYYDNKKIRSVFDFYYRNIVKKVIYHSAKTKVLLDEASFKGVKLYVPHFKYSVDYAYDIKNVGEDVSRHFNTSKKKFLFFGNLRKVKGVDIIVDYFSKNNFSEDIELVIAGKNVENIDFTKLRNQYGIVDRHINDDELKYLYSKTDYVLLPYRDSSQSGILEMAFNFRKPMLLSDIPYFRDLINKFPSFGTITNIEKYGDLLEDIIEDKIKTNYYRVEDCNKFMMKNEIDDFKSNLLNYIQ